jgi:endonuclease-8
MPEGDTIFRTARTLGQVLAGKTVTAFRSPLPGLDKTGLAGRRVIQVVPRGKNLLMHFDDGRVLHTHLMMTGSWHVYRPGEPWLKPARQARVVIETADFVAVCFNAPVVELVLERAAARRPMLSRLGPDLLGSEFDLAEARRRLRTRDELTIGEALLVQSLTAGIGNVFKSETLFLCGVDPFVRLRDLADGALDRLLRKARELMQANLQGYPRVTRRGGGNGGRHWVYGRKGQPCYRCGTPIQMRRQGLAARSTYWCAVCQRAGGDSCSCS